MNIIIHNIKESLGMKLKHIAKLSGCDYTTLSLFYNEKRNLPQSAAIKLIKFCKSYGLNYRLDYIFQKEIGLSIKEIEQELGFKLLLPKPKKGG
jgi:transcriptional regulator with XRE-family HTH domain